MKPEDKSRLIIDKKLKESGWAVQDVKDHIAVSLSIEPSDLDLNPFDRKGGLGRFYEIFGEGYAAILTEMNLELVA